MSITYRAQKGAPLTADEIDENFKELEDRITQLEDHPEGGESLGKIHLEKDKLSFTGSLGTDLGTFNLPRINEIQTLPSLSLYEKATLPAQSDLGKMALLLENEERSLIYFDGNTWKVLLKGDLL